MVVKRFFRIREVNKSVNCLIGAVLKKLWQCLEFEQLSLMRNKSVSMVKIC